MKYESESKFLEFKEALSNSIFKSISAFANFHDGEIIIGVKDDGTVIGLENISEIKLDIENAINDSILPRPYYEFSILEDSGKRLLVLKVFKGEFTPYLFKGKAYMRSDTASIQVDKSQYENLILQGRNLTFEDLVNDDQVLTFQELEFQLKKILNITQLTPDLLKTLGLIKDGKYNHAAALLSDDNPLRSSEIDLIAYMDASVKNIRDRESLVNMSLLKQFVVCLEFYYKHINRAELINGIYRETIEEVPLIAYREAIANMIIHRDYSMSAHARVEIFADRIEIVSPGSLPYGMSEEEFRDGRLSLPRNPKVADIFFRLRIVEKLATGIRRIKEYYHAYDVTPKFLVGDHSVTVILPKIAITGRKIRNVQAQENQHDQMAEQNLNREQSGLPEKVTSSLVVKPELNEKEQLMYQLICENPAITRAELQNHIDLGKTQTAEIIQNLRHKGYIIKTGNGPKSAYKAANATN